MGDMRIVDKGVRGDNERSMSILSYRSWLGSGGERGGGVASMSKSVLIAHEGTTKNQA